MSDFYPRSEFADMLPAPNGLPSLTIGTVNRVTIVKVDGVWRYCEKGSFDRVGEAKERRVRHYIDAITEIEAVINAKR